MMKSHREISRAMRSISFFQNPTDSPITIPWSLEPESSSHDP